MKKALLIFAFLLCKTTLFAQQDKSVDYQYLREDGKYFAFELLVPHNFQTDYKLQINFSANCAYEKIEKITITAGTEEMKLKFKPLEEVIKTDNPELKFYPITINWKDFKDRGFDCELRITFKLDNGTTCTLPFSLCKTRAFLAQN